MRRGDVNEWSGAEEALIIPAGTRPGGVADLLAAIQAEFAPAAGMPRPGRVIVPVEPDADVEAVRKLLRERVAEPLSPAVSVILQTSGSTTGRGHLVGLSRLALSASAHATAAAFAGHGRWILPLPAHHIAGFQVLVRSVIAGHRPTLVDTTKGFTPEALARAARRAVRDDGVPVYTSVVPTQLRRIVSNRQACEALRPLTAILVGGQASDPQLLAQAKANGLPVVTTYGMTETCGGCVYDGVPLRGVKVATIDQRIWISGTTLMDGYVDAPGRADIVAAGGRRWLRTSDAGRMVGAKLEVIGRVDSVINTGGVKVQPDVVEESIKSLPDVGDVCGVGLPHATWGQTVAAVFVPAPDANPRSLRAMRARRGLDVEPLDDAVEPVSSPELKEAMAALQASIRGSEEETDLLGQVRIPQALTDDDHDIAVHMRAHVAAELGRAQAPRIVCMVDELPLLGIGKVDRRKVRQIALRHLENGWAWTR